MASAARDLHLELPHHGYEDGEVPRYADCPYGCAMRVRADRLDLIEEHYAVCAATRPAGTWRDAR